MSIRIDGTNTTANPGITGGDADTGLQFGTDEVSIVTGGTNRITASTDIVFNNSSGTERIRMQSGGGISFNGDTAAANALDDYEEGTWTPSNPNVTYSNVYGWYTKVGNTVHTWGRIQVPTNSNGNVFVIDGLPYIVKADQYTGAVAITDIGSSDILPMYNQNTYSIVVRNSLNNDYSLSFVSGKFFYFWGSYQTN